MGLFCAKSLFYQNPKNPSFPGVFLSGTRNPGFKILPRIGNTSFEPFVIFVDVELASDCEGKRINEF